VAAAGHPSDWVERRLLIGRLAGTPVDVLVNIMLDFWIR
jgi:hypothetical protein